ncbi:uncharacterized protein LOC123875881 [Maniola jurtina]|uniref:uncharacterized protein LOC123875881 n=1 Tax=Maniola jurtina TaxID=191418 RepID=UPI001E68B2FA|nr:uncharacterized protein LOC123875881 [Maniola jurtina]
MERESDTKGQVHDRLPYVLSEARGQSTANFLTPGVDIIYLHQHASSTDRNARQRVVGAILPNFEAWLGRKHGSLTFRLTQVLTGHGCFGEYLCRIGREVTPRCHHCGEVRDSAQHTLEECPAWEPERHILVSYVGRDLSPPAVIAAMLEDSEAWRAVVSFCEVVMCKKEAAERDRERADPSRRRRHQGGADQRSDRSIQ